MQSLERHFFSPPFSWRDLHGDSDQSQDHVGRVGWELLPDRALPGAERPHTGGVDRAAQSCHPPHYRFHERQRMQSKNLPQGKKIPVFLQRPCSHKRVDGGSQLVSNCTIFGCEGGAHMYEGQFSYMIWSGTASKNKLATFVRCRQEDLSSARSVVSFSKPK